MSGDLLGDIYGDVPRADPKNAGLRVGRSELVVHGDLAHLLDALEVFVRRYVVLDEAQATATTLWVAHTWAIEAAYATPYLFVNSAEPESGKTRLLEVLHELAREPLSTMNISDAALFRAIDQRKPTLFLDEVDAIFSKRAQERGAKDELRSLLNAGYRRGGRVLRMGGGNNTTLQEFEVFGAKALAGLGSLPPTLASRCLRIELKRRRADEPVSDFFPQDVAEEASALRTWLEKWTATTIDTLAVARPSRVDGLRDRTNEVWRPLLAIAEEAGEVWAARARRAAHALSGAGDDEASLGVLLLGDVRAVFEERKVPRIATADLIYALSRFDENPWAEWWIDDKTGDVRSGAARRLAHLLRPFGIRSNITVRVGEKTAKGYRREDFLDAWERFLPSGVEESHQSHQSQPAPHGQTDVTDVTDVTDMRESANGRVPLPGDDDFLDFILAAHRAGHITTAEALEREKTHKLIREVAA
jgi:Protein of unknown function (DUF3631)